MVNLIERGWQWVRARRRLNDYLKLWYHPEYSPSSIIDNFLVPNVEPRRAERILARMVAEGLVKPSEVQLAPKAKIAQLQRFHSFAYLESLNEPEVLAPIFGLNTEEVEVGRILKASLYGVGGTIDAAVWAAEEPNRAAVNLGGGFHHAQPERGSGFCAHNDVGVAIGQLRENGYTGRILIVDLDFHQGDGNAVGFQHDPNVLVYSLHGSEWTQIQSDSVVEVLLEGTVGDRRYLEKLSATLPEVFNRFDPELVFYVAGNDVLGHDRLGHYWLTLEGLLQRDVFVARLVRRRGLSMVVTLGGGYSREAWIGSANFLRYLLTDAITVIRPHEASLGPMVTRITRELRPDDPDRKAKDNDFGLTEADLFGATGPHTKQRRFLGYYSLHGIEVAMERYGLLGKIRERGFFDIKVEMDASDASHELLRLFARRFREGPMLLLMELVLRRVMLPAPWEDAEGSRIELLSIEWLLQQDPSRGFSLSRPPLPGQDHPGLGVAELTRTVLTSTAKRISLHGVIHRAAYYHTGWGQSKVSHFLDPVYEGRFFALEAVLEGLSLAEASQAVYEGRVRYGDGSAYTWEAEPQVLPVSGRMSSFFRSHPYRDAVRKAKAELHAAGLHLAPKSA